jgi:hypothetical protein
MTKEQKEQFLGIMRAHPKSNYTQIAKILNDKGIKWLGKKPFDNMAVSYAARKCGIWKFKKTTKATKSSAVKITRTPDTDALAELVFKSSISKAAKLKLLEVLL